MIYHSLESELCGLYCTVSNVKHWEEGWGGLTLVNNPQKSSGVPLHPGQAQTPSVAFTDSPGTFCKSFAMTHVRDTFQELQTKKMTCFVSITPDC